MDKTCIVKELLAKVTVYADEILSVYFVPKTYVVSNVLEKYVVLYDGRRENILDRNIFRMGKITAEVEVLNIDIRRASCRRNV